MTIFRSGVAAVLLLAAGCSRSTHPSVAGDAAAVPVQVAAVTSTVMPQTQAVAGTVRPFERATIAAKVTGTVATTHLVVGQPVSAGEILVTLQARELGARLDQPQPHGLRQHREAVGDDLEGLLVEAKVLGHTVHEKPA